MGHRTDIATRNEVLEYNPPVRTEVLFVGISSACWNKGRNWLTVKYTSRCPVMIVSRMGKRNASKL